MSELQLFDPLKASIREFVKPLSEIQVRDIAENAAALGALKTVKELAKQIELKRTELVSPLHAEVKRINAYAKEIGAPLEAVEKMVKAHMGDFAQAEADRREKELIRIEAEKIHALKKLEAERKAAEKEYKAEKKALDAFGVDDGALEDERDDAKRKFRAEFEEKERAAAMKTKNLEASRPKNTSTVWKYEIVEPTEIPDRYFMIDEALIGKDVRAGARDIPGVRIYSETVVVAR